MRGLGIASMVCISLVLITSLAGCQILVEPQEPPATWLPLPTVGLVRTPPVVNPTEMPSTAAPPTAVFATPTTVSVPTRPSKISDPALGASLSRDQAWAYLLANYPDPRFPKELIWEGPEVQGMIGATKYRYQAGYWTATIAVPLVAPEKVVYEVSLTGPGGYRWEAQVHPDGRLAAEAPEVGVTPEPVSGIQGTLHVLPDTAAFDDYFQQLGDDGVQYGVEGADEAMRKEIAALRGTGQVVQLWGSLQRGVPDYGDAQLLVSQILVIVDLPTRTASPQPAATRSAPTQVVSPAPTRTTMPRTEAVEGWIGVVRLLPPGSAYNDFFDGQQPSRQIGLVGAIAPIDDQLAAAAASGTPVRIWGILEIGVDDYGQGRIVVSHIETL